MSSYFINLGEMYVRPEAITAVADMRKVGWFRWFRRKRPTRVRLGSPYDCIDTNEPASELIERINRACREQERS